MMARLRLGILAQLLLAFALDLALMFALGVFALYLLAGMNTAATFVEQTTIPSLNRIAAIELILTRYRSLQLEYLINNSTADRERIEHDMAVLETEMQTSLADNELWQSGAAYGAFEQLQQSWQEYAAAVNERFLPALRVAGGGTVQPVFNRLNPLFDAVRNANAALSGQSQADASAALSGVRASYRSARYVIGLETLVSLLVSLLVGWLLAARIARRIRRLTAATTAVAAGDLERRVAVRGSDEISHLALSFNQMVASLNAQQALLEIRNHELQASLHMQQQLTDDLLRRKQAEQDALRAQSSAEAASKAKSLFLATMSHELRTPLNAITGYAQVLMLQVRAADQDHFVPPLERIKLASRHLLTLISNVLDFSKIEQGRIDVYASDMNLQTLAEDVVAIVQPLADDQQTSVTLSVQTPQPLLHSDDGKVRQILLNVLSNAIKFTQAGTIDVLIREALFEQRHALAIAVCDSGIGMNPEQQARVFQPFTQGDESIGRRYGGTGLGMALSLQLATLLGGMLTLSSRAGHGTTFTLVLPDYVASADDLAVPIGIPLRSPHESEYQ